MENNAYYEQAASRYWNDIDEENLIQKIKECQEVTDKLESSSLFGILKKDAEEKRAYLDDNWQDVVDDKIMNNMRVKKSAVKYILTLPDIYKDELNRAKEELKKRTNTGEEIIKDYDEE